MANHAGWLLGLALIAPMALPSQTAAAEHHRLFGCRIEQSPSDFMSIHAVQEDDGSWHDLQFLIEKDGIMRQSVRELRDAETRVFYFSNSEGPEGYLAQVRFSGGGRDYVLAMLDIPPDGTEGDMGGRVTALTITEADGTSHDLTCGEVDEYIGYMQEAMACDMTNRYGVAGCNFDERPLRDADDALPPALR